MKKIAFIGIGVMGISMARNLMKNSFEVFVYTRTKTKADALISEGAHWCDSIEECVNNKDAIITIVGFPKDVQQVYFGTENAKGILQCANSGTYIIDMTTTSPSLWVNIYNEAKKRGLHPLDAPVSGGDIGAKNASLSIMVGGEKNDFYACMPLFNAMGKSIAYMGKAGNGQLSKAANQIAIAGTLSGVCEAIAFAQKNGINANELIDVIKNGAAGSWQLINNGARILSDDMNPGFYIKHYIKDLNIAKTQSEINAIDLPILNQVLNMYMDLQNNGEEDLGTQALIHKYI